MSSSAPNGTDRPRQAPEGRGHDFIPAQASGAVTGQADRVRATADHDRAPESGPARSAGGPRRRDDSSGKGLRLDTLVWIVIFASFVCAGLAELFESVGWGDVAAVAGGLSGFLVLLVLPALGVYFLVKMLRGEAQLP
jgi:hypothetical protein